MLSLRKHMQTTISSIVQEGSYAIDATAGNGYDTLFLAQCVGDTGHVYSFDIQAQAIESTTTLLHEHNMYSRVTLLHTGHERMQTCVPNNIHNRIQAIVYNLGYLPRSSKEIITKPDTTLEALEQSLILLASKGILFVHAYQGHTGGEEEYTHVYNFFTTIPWDIAHVASYEFINKNSHRETLFLAEKQ